MGEVMDLRAATARAARLAEGPQRVILGLTGPPGCGKSTVADALRAAVGDAAIVVPMDGFHLADAALDELGLRSRKGAPETFDSWGYAALLERLRRNTEPTVYAPMFERGLEQPLAGAIAVNRDVRLVITEGNYLLGDADGWPAARAPLDEVWYVDAPDGVRRQRLLARHELFGKAPAAARAWVTSVDEPNARLIAATRDRADRLVAVD